MTKLYKQNRQIVLYLSDGVLHNGVTRVLSAFYINQLEHCTMANTIDNTQDVIDSREIIERIEELESSKADHQEDPEGGHWSDEEEAELKALKAIADEVDHVSDWTHGETLIREDHFTQYIEDLIDDCYEMPKEMNSGKWPYRHMTMDYEAAAEEAKVDYEEVDFDGVTYYIRSV
jgi:hypothetical protein